ncbi:hypothetical protein HaLaN_22624, partial [Haematococcus lacustris]
MAPRGRDVCSWHGANKEPAVDRDRCDWAGYDFAVGIHHYTTLLKGPALAPLAQKPERPARREPSKEELEEVRFAFDTLVAGSPNGRVSPKQ